MSPTLEAEGLSKRFGSFPALDAANFRYEGSGAIGYLGPNGAGKTTTLKLFTGLLRPSGGHARINGLDVAEDPKGALWETGALIETPEPYPSQTGREALAMIGAFRGLSKETVKERTDRYAKLLELPPLDRRTAKLSKGQKQRICFAGILLAEPSVLLLDEPTSGLDPAERVVIRNVLVELKKADRLILMSSHLLQEVTEICDQLIFINQGKILLRETVANLAARFRVTRLDVEFARAVEPSALQALPGVTNIESVGPTHFRFSFDGEEATRAKLLEACQKLAPVTSFASSSLTIEEAYLKLFQAPS